jgi:hypothetical protein
VLGQVHVLPGVAHVAPLSLAQSALVQQAALEMHDMLPMHSFSPDGHAHTPPGMEQTWPVRVHSPVLQQVPMGMQVPEAAQATWPAGHEPAEQVPFMHVPVPQMLPHVPQLDGSLFRFAQYGAPASTIPVVPESTGEAVPVSAAPASLAEPPPSLSPEPESTTGAPASAGPPHRVSPPEQPAAHLPCEHTSPEEQTVPHVPQFFGSVAVMVHVDPHLVLPPVQPEPVSPVASVVVPSEPPPSSPPCAEELAPVAQPPPPSTTPRTSANMQARSERCWFIGALLGGLRRRSAEPADARMHVE